MNLIKALVAIAVISAGGNLRAQDAPAPAPSGSPKPVRSAEMVFDLRDKNKDGKLTAEEFAGKLGADPARMEKFKAQFTKLDANGDGVLTLEEFKAQKGFASPTPSAAPAQ